MKKLLNVSLLLLMSVFLIGCGGDLEADGSNEHDGETRKEKKEPEIVGSVMQKENDTILVVSGEAEDFSDTGGVEEFYKAIWISGVQEDVKIGEKVKVWVDGPILESYPAQGRATAIEVLTMEKPEGAILTEADVIRKVLEKREEVGALAFKLIHFDQDTSSWTVHLKNTFTDREETVHVDDQ